MALAFNGTTQYLSKGAGTFSISGNMSMSAWFTTPSATTSGFIMAVSTYTDATPDVGTLRSLRLRGDVAGDPISAQHGGAGIAQTTTGYSINTWHHACGTFTGATSRTIYLDGGSKTTNSGVGPVDRTADNIYVGAIGVFSSISGYFPGSVAEAGIWNVVLTDAEAAILAKGVSPLMVRPASLVFYAPLIGRASPETDLVGGYSMTLNNTPTTAVHPRVLRASGLWTSKAAAGAPPSGGTIPVIYHHLQQQGIG